VGDCAPPCDGVDEFFTLMTEQLFDRVVARDDELGVPEGCLAPFVLSRAGVLVQPDLEEMAEAIGVHVIENDGLLASVAIPPLGLILDEGIGILLPSSKGFTGACWSPVVVSPTRVSSNGYRLSEIVEVCGFD